VALTFELPLVGPQGEPVDLFRTILSHGVADLPPARVDEAAGAYETTVALPAGRPRTIRIAPGAPGTARVDVRGPRLGERGRSALVETVRKILNLDEDLLEFYGAAAGDPELDWAVAGAGRMLRTPTVFEAVVKTSCTDRRLALRDRPGFQALFALGFRADLGEQDPVIGRILTVRLNLHQGWLHRLRWIRQDRRISRRRFGRERSFLRSVLVAHEWSLAASADASNATSASPQKKRAKPHSTESFFRSTTFRSSRMRSISPAIVHRRAWSGWSASCC
jgi:hypothetical protein